MIRTLITASALAGLAAFSTPVFAADSVRVTLTGKSTQTIYAEIVGAARKVCRAESLAHPMMLGNEQLCVKETVAETITKVGSSSLTQYAGSGEAVIQLASN